MHYIPASFLQIESPGSPDGGKQAEDLHRYFFWPLYLLAILTGVLLGVDQLIAWVNSPPLLMYQKLFGFRLALIAAVLGGARILYQTLDGLFEGKIGADLALTIATLSAIILGEPVVAALVVFIALLGESLEGLVAGRAHQTLSRLFELCPRIVHRYDPVLDLEQDIALSSVNLGDSLSVRPGERIPVDGTILRGRTEIDQSALTGESWPVTKTEGDAVHAGTLNQHGGILIEVEKTGNDTTFGQIVQLVSQAIQKKSPIERQADRLARIFLPVVLGIAALTLLLWRIRVGYWSAGWMPALSVLVVACPCPLILATPSAVLAAMSWLAKRGIVVKSSEVLERLSQVNCLAIDKTGTVTSGELQITRIVPAGDLSADELLRIAASAERRSEHLLGRLLVQTAEGKNLILPVPASFQISPGLGVLSEYPSNPFEDHGESTEASAQVLVGNVRWMELRNTSLPSGLQETLQAVDKLGETPLLVALSGRYLGLICVRDQPRRNAFEILNDLKSCGLGEATLLTGDRKGVARRVAEELGIENRFEAELLPSDKAAWIEKRQLKGEKVLMVGDGINDAPALATATVGIALGGIGSQIAAEAGDVILMGDPLAPLPGLVRISREVVANIRQSILLFAFGMNGLGMALSAFGWLNPVGAAIFHEGASLAVMFNALRLLWFESWNETPSGQILGNFFFHVEQFLEQYSLNRLTAFAVQNFSTILRLAFCCAMIVWSLSNLLILREGEEALVTRLGRQEQLLQPGLHLRWPWPLERVYREKTGLIQVIQLGFRGEGEGDSQGKPTAAIEWQAEHRGTRYQSIGNESFMFGGEEVPVELTSELHFRITSLPDYLLNGTQPREILRSLMERVFRELVSVRNLEDILTEGRSELEQQALSEMKTRIQRSGLGVELLEISLLDVHPPLPVIPDYRKVSDAMEYQEELINEGQRTYIREMMLAIGEPGLHFLTGGKTRPGSREPGIEIDWKLTEQEWNSLIGQQPGAPPETSRLGGLGADLLQTAHATRNRLIQEAQGESDSFLNLVETYHRNPDLTRSQVFWESHEKFLSNQPLTILDPRAAGRRQWLIGPPVFDSILRSSSSATQTNVEDSSNGNSGPSENSAPVEPASLPATTSP